MTSCARAGRILAGEHEAARALADGDTLLIGRIELFTGSLSEANIELYEREGYVQTERIDQGDGTATVFLRKRL